MDEDNAFSPNIRNSMTYLKKKLKRSENERRYSMPRTAMKNKESEFHNHLSSVLNKMSDCMLENGKSKQIIKQKDEKIQQLEEEIKKLKADKKQRSQPQFRHNIEGSSNQFTSVDHVLECIIAVLTLSEISDNMSELNLQIQKTLHLENSKHFKGLMEKIQKWKRDIRNLEGKLSQCRCDREF
eukprot:UN28180